jgi:hypothetical protein
MQTHDFLAKKFKDAKYADACKAANFRAFVLEIFGGCVANAEEVVQPLATLMMRHKTASSRAHCIEHIWRLLSVAMQRGTPDASFEERHLTTSQIGSCKFHSEHPDGTYHLPCIEVSSTCLQNLHKCFSSFEIRLSL